MKNLLRPLSLKARLTAIFIAVFGGSLVAYSIYVYRTVDQIFQSGFDLQLYEFAKEVGDSINYSVLWGFQFDTRGFADNKRIFPFTMREAVIQIRSGTGVNLVSSRGLRGQELPFNKDIYERILEGEYVHGEWDAKTSIAGNTHFRTLSFLVKGSEEQFVILQVAVPDRFIRQNTRKITNIFVYSIPILLLISGLLGYTYAGYSLKPVNRIVERVYGIRRGNLSERVPVPATKDEISKLATTLNEMLERVERAFEAQERFVSDASHQMKTPLAILKAQIEELSQADNADENTLGSLKEEVNSLISLVNNLLILARIDVGEETLLFSEVQLGEAVTNVCERLSPLAKEKDIQFQLNLAVESEDLSDNPFVVSGDNELLMSLFQSIIENSIKYSNPHSTVQIKVLESQGKVIVEIQDAGPGLTESELHSIFERFRRGESSAKGVSGSGLGLSIAKRISELHSAELTIENGPESGLITRFIIKKV